MLLFHPKNRGGREIGELATCHKTAFTSTSKKKSNTNAWRRGDRDAHTQCSKEPPSLR